MRYWWMKSEKEINAKEGINVEGIKQSSDSLLWTKDMLLLLTESKELQDMLWNNKQLPRRIQKGSEQKLKIGPLPK